VTAGGGGPRLWASGVEELDSCEWVSIRGKLYFPAFPLSRRHPNDHGPNYLALWLWGLNNQRMELANLGLVNTAAVQTGYGNVEFESDARVGEKGWGVLD